MGINQNRESLAMTKTTCEHSGIEWDTDFPMEPRLPHSTDGSYLITAWISVKDRLPEQDEYVLTYLDCSTKSIRVNWYSTHRLQWNEGDDGITHWMPLPLPPKGSE